MYIAPWKVAIIVAVCLLGALFAVPNLVSRETAEQMPSWLPHRQINLGLDLRGGSHILLQVDGDSVIRERVEALVDSLRDELRQAQIVTQSIVPTPRGMAISLVDPAQSNDAEKLIRGFDPEVTVEEPSAGRIDVTLTEDGIHRRLVGAVDQAMEIIRRRIDETGTREPTIQRQGADRILVQLPGVDDPARMKALIGKTAKMTFHLVDEEADPAQIATGRAPPGSMVLPMLERQRAPGAEDKIAVRRRILVSGENLVDAQPTFQQNEPVVSFRFDAVGGRRFGDATTQNVGKRLAIVLDNQVISAPVIREPILGGTGIISGSFDVAGARDLALLLRAGALPAPLTTIEERTVGPGLGADSIAAGEIACVIGVIAVAVFMILVYGLFGIFAVLALTINLILIIGALSALQATLTLPGIAGIVLTIGMAVDANVLIFEHIREEIRAGRTPVSALDAGFNRAMSAIVDSNLTTIISALFLYFLGAGPVRGFAVTLAVGIVTSLFTAISVTRLIIAVWLRRARPRLIPI
jgi:protein-export membrane protein, SecD/SecF family